MTKRRAHRTHRTRRSSSRRREIDRALPSRAKDSKHESAEAARGLSSSCACAAIGLDACAKHTSDARVAQIASAAARAARALADDARALAAPGDRARAPRMSERLRWEWIASSSKVLDGSADARLLDESARLLASARAHVSELRAALSRGADASRAVALSEALSRAQADVAAAAALARVRFTIVRLCDIPATV